MIPLLGKSHVPSLTPEVGNRAVAAAAVIFRAEWLFCKTLKTRFLL